VAPKTRHHADTPLFILGDATGLSAVRIGFFAKPQTVDAIAEFPPAIEAPFAREKPLLFALGQTSP